MEVGKGSMTVNKSIGRFVDAIKKAARTPHRTIKPELEYWKVIQQRIEQAKRKRHERKWRVRVWRWMKQVFNDTCNAIAGKEQA